jgi:SSS family solute:Na+ symporter
MNLTLIDWLIVSITIILLYYGVRLSKKLVRSVADYLSAGRSVGRYLLTVSHGMAYVGAITIIGSWEMNYIAGFTQHWWGFTMALVMLIIAASGWVVYRFRETRVLTVAQFLEVRYSKNFRIFAGILAFLSGILNFGIFPAVSARFLIYFIGIPASFHACGLEIPTFPLVMASFLLLSFYFVFVGGQIAIIITEFFQGIFSNITYLIIVVFCLWFINWDQIFQALQTVPKDASLINPYKTGNMHDFNLMYYIISVAGIIYTKLSWQGSQGYNSSAKNAHEAKMAEVLNTLLLVPKYIFFIFVPIIAYTVLHHNGFSNIASVVNNLLATIGNSQIQSEMRTPIVLSQILPVGVKGLLVTLMLMTTISTHNSYMHSWGSIFIQDVIMPFKKTQFKPEEHLKILRFSILGVCIFIYIFSILFPMTDYIFLYFSITAAIFTGGSGAVIIGGLYWKKGTTSAAWCALLTGSTISVTGIVLQQFYPHFPINGQQFWGIAMAVSSIIYIIVSLINNKPAFNMEKMLHRGQYASLDENIKVNKPSSKRFRILGITKEFTQKDKIIYYVTYGWTFLWVIVFIVGTIINLSKDVPDSSWLSFWHYYVIINLVISVFIIIWFIFGGTKDMRNMIQKLKTMKRDYNDNGTVNEETSK